ncbi:P22_AR N-terminal domain-containing protein [Methylomagnum ishizawai]|uniref:P22_AR N-terminal domain-containing protein n=1 Tax=Methylomagnum ishizawai TaxID=1760988 RepID=A0A1Y6CUU6_9GAMM|nr:phage antirepressor N-terminal domain-containing protein [Methylomagnum ishizawai]SMF94408.1 P22_AR N-terminal domain-containing protein [Methylomagnum ishizawai]
MSASATQTPVQDSGRVRLSLEFAGVILPIAKDEHGRDIVPLKPISDVFGLDWEKQRIKVNNGISRRLGTCTHLMVGGGQGREMTCIRLDRVAAYLNTINPEKVRAVGNEVGADFLERKQEEWDDLIHAYEMRSGMFATQAQREASARSRKVRDLLAVAKEKRNTQDQADRRVLGGLMKGLAADLGVPYQEELDA